MAGTTPRTTPGRAVEQGGVGGASPTVSPLVEPGTQKTIATTPRSTEPVASVPGETAAQAKAAQTGKQTGQRAVNETAQRVQQGGALMGDTGQIMRDYGQHAVAAILKLADDNIGEFHAYDNDTVVDRFAEEVVAKDWLGRVISYDNLSTTYGLKDVKPSMSVKDLSSALVIGLTESGTYVMLGPGTVWGQDSSRRTNTQRVNGPGLMALRFVDVRGGGGRVRPVVDPSQKAEVVPVAVPATNPETGTNVDVIKYNYNNKQWEIEDGQVPQPGSPLKVKTASGYKMSTSPLYKVRYVTNPADAQAIMRAFDGAAEVVDSNAQHAARATKVETATHPRTAGQRATTPATHPRTAPKNP